MEKITRLLVQHVLEEILIPVASAPAPVTIPAKIIFVTKLSKIVILIVKML
jgi:hypothetical protein